MRKSSSFATTALGWGLLVAAVLALAFGGQWLFGLLMGLQKEVAAAIIAAGATVVVSVLAVVLGKYFERRSAIEQSLRAEKVPMYQGIISFWFRILNGEKLGKKPLSEQQTLVQFDEITQKLLIWGSDDAVRSWVDFRLSSFAQAEGADGTQGNASVEGLRLFGKFLKAVRRDMGHANKGVSVRTLLGLFINDVDQYVDADD